MVMLHAKPLSSLSKKKKWHFIHIAVHLLINLDHHSIKMMFLGVSKMHQIIPKNKDLDVNASHGHAHMPENVWLSSVLWLYNKVFTSYISPSLAS